MSEQSSSDAANSSNLDIVEPGDAVARLRSSTAKRVAVFLGAGASRTFGYPLTSQILPGILDRLSDPAFLAPLDDPRPADEYRTVLRRYLFELMPGKERRRDNLPLVTALLSLLDFSVATGQSVLASTSAQETREARRLLERAILEVIADEDPFGPTEAILLEHFYGLLADLWARGGERLDVVTTNYDLAADESVFEAVRVESYSKEEWDHDDMARHVDFGFDWVFPTDEDPARMAERPRQPRASLFKLHGSTNWLKCPLCDNVYINADLAIWKQAYRGVSDNLNTCHCTRTKLEAQIVSPSFVREMREPHLLSVWKCALDALRRADEWLIVGYSFPDEDLAVRALFTRAYNSRGYGSVPNPPGITVVQKGIDAYGRYDAFFDRERLTYATGGLDAFVTEWKRQRG